MSIDINNLTKIYQTQKALDNLSLSIHSGEIVGLLGPNGAGKSTLMKILTCYIPPTHGSASVCGFDVMREPIEVKKRIGYLPEHNPLYLDMYIKEYLAFIGGMYKVPHLNKRVAEMIELTGLGIEQHKKIGAISKGYRQRVGLAQALIHNPQVLILDEPTSGLDPNQLVEIRQLIKEIGKEKTILLSTHIMQEVEAVTDRILIIKSGKLVTDKQTEDTAMPKGEAIMITLELKETIAKEDLQQLLGVVRVIPEGHNKWLLECHSDIRQDIFQFAVTHQYTVLSLQMEKQRLEDLFRQVTN